MSACETHEWQQRVYSVEKLLLRSYSKNSRPAEASLLLGRGGPRDLQLRVTRSYPTLDCWSHSSQYRTVTFVQHRPNSSAVALPLPISDPRRWIANSPHTGFFIIQSGPTPRHPP